MIDILDLSRKALNFAQNPSIETNATITYQISTGNSLAFDDVGNPIVENAVISTKTIQCYLRVASAEITAKMIGNDDLSGNNSLWQYYYGRLVSPKVLQFPIIADGDIEIQINGRKGRLLKVFNLESPFSEQTDLSANLGQKIFVRLEFYSNY